MTTDDNLTTRDLETPAPKYIIRTSLGFYLLLWEELSSHPDMTASRQAARQLDEPEADKMLEKLTRRGIKAKKVDV